MQTASLPRCLRVRTSGAPHYLDAAARSALALAGANSKNGGGRARSPSPPRGATAAEWPPAAGTAWLPEDTRGQLGEKPLNCLSVAL
jgi:hypothetical protein